ncbi:unnamed protein product [Clonostachys solani]|uniref:Uncharacterized protein n=1 Tax=Clonostachys solani TaxID=160281 RepID=A0A9N9YYF8_9HYPO|nr:unnamed protein product [Clonostachys solani]
MADEATTITLRQLLTQKKPDTLNASYGYVLDCPILEPLDVLPSLKETFSGLAVKIDLDINHLIGWNAAMVKATFDFSRSRLHLNDESALELVTTLREGQEASKELLWPARQLLAICKVAGTRYGYIQTDMELVVCRFTKNVDEEWKVAMMPIPVTTSGAGALTADLALWWICMLAISSPTSSAIVPEGEVVEIDRWNVSGEHLGFRTGCHVYSNYTAPWLEPYEDFPSQTQANPDNVASGVDSTDLTTGVNFADFTTGVNFANVATSVNPEGLELQELSPLSQVFEFNEGSSQVQK